MTPRLAIVGVALLVVLAGCGGGGQKVEASGSPATVSDDALADAGYELTDERNETFEATVEGSISGDVELQGKAQVTAHAPVRVYRPAGDGDSVVALVSSPGARPISNRPILKDPFATMSPAERVNFAQSVHEIEEVEETGERTVSYLGNETTLTTYSATTAGGASVTVALGSVQHEGDFVTVVAVWVDAEPPLERLLEGVSH